MHNPNRLQGDDEFRFVAAVVALFVAGFIGVHWLATGVLVQLPTVTHLRPDARVGEKTREDITPDPERDWPRREFFVAGYFGREDMAHWAPFLDEVLSGASPTGHACNKSRNAG